MKALTATLAVMLLACLVLAPLPARAADPVEIPLIIEKNRFEPGEIKVKAGAPFVLVITNKDKSAEEFESKDLKIEKVIAGGKTVKVKVPALKAGTYKFFGEYHEATAQGRIVAE
jgi:plastocyanin